MPSYKTAFGSWLKTEDLQGREVAVTIESVSPRKVKDNDTGELENKLVAHFVGKEKELILNMTNCDLLTQITGTEDYERWVGARVVLYPTTTRFGNKTVPCLRIKVLRPFNPAPTAGNGAFTGPAPVYAPPAQTAPPVYQPPPTYDPPQQADTFDNAPITDDDIPFVWLAPFIVPFLAATTLFV